MLKKTLKWLAIIIGLILVALIVLGLFLNEAKPIGSDGAEADALANKMLRAIDKPAWDSTKYITWTFMGVHSYLWDRERDFVKVSWNDNVVLLHTKSITGKVFKKGNLVPGEETQKMIQDAWSFFCNDSFWLNAPAKIFDPGTSRSVVNLDTGEKALMIKYDSGGVTPGDTYLWILDQNNLPKAWKMWVKIIPIGGIGATWERWQTLASGAKIASAHKLGPMTLTITDIKDAQNWSELGIDNDPFKLLSK